MLFTPPTSLDASDVINSGAGIVAGSTLLQVNNLTNSGTGLFFFSTTIVTGNVTNTGSSIMKVGCAAVQGNASNTGGGLLFLESDLPPSGSITGPIAAPWYVTRAITAPAPIATYNVSSPTPVIQFISLPSFPSYRIEISSLQIDTAVDVALQLSTDNGGTWVNTGYVGSTSVAGADGTSYGSYGTWPVYMMVMPFCDATTPASGTLRLYGMNDSSMTPQMTTNVVAWRTGQSFINSTGYTCQGLGSAANAFQLMLGSPANFVAGSVRVFGEN